MQIKHLMALLQELPPELHVVLHDEREVDFFSITELTPEYLRPCTIWYPHFDRAPKLAKPDTPQEKRLDALFVGTWLPT
jgi:hypothetical protein